MADIETYAGQQKDIQTEARNFEREQDRERAQANRFDFGEVLLEIALVITSITLLARRRIWWKVGMVLAVFGVVATASGFAVH